MPGGEPVLILDIGAHPPVIGAATPYLAEWSLAWPTWQLPQRSQGITVFSVPFLTLVIVVILAALAGVAAAILPSRRAAKLNVLRAIVTE